MFFIIFIYFTPHREKNVAFADVWYDITSHFYALNLNCNMEFEKLHQIVKSLFYSISLFEHFKFPKEF